MPMKNEDMSFEEYRKIEKIINQDIDFNVKCVIKKMMWLSNDEFDVIIKIKEAGKDVYRRK